MNEARIEANADGGVALIGELNHQTVPALLKASLGMLFKGNDARRGDVAIDLAKVSRSDSAGVALLLEWLRQAKKAGRGIRFNNMPPQMHELARVAGVDKLLAAAGDVR